MKSKTANIIPLIATSLVPTATLTSVLAPLPALGATGDLDPGFGDFGRLGPILNGPAWSLKPLADGTMLLGGGNLYFDYYYYTTVVANFVRRVTEAGAIDPGFTAGDLGSFQVLDIVRQSDGKVVGVGRKVDTRRGTSQFAVFRLQTDGPLDTTFGTNGTFTLAAQGPTEGAMSAVLDPDLRIVVAGSQAGRLIVLRLLPDGSLDASFGTLGVFTGPETYNPPEASPGARTGILRTAAGGYRVTISNAAGCQIIALTAVGAIDTTFGASGVVTVDTPVGPSAYCSSMVSQPDEHLLVAGSADGQGFAARILANGQQDTGFSAEAVSAAMAEATAVAAGTDGSVIVAGRSISGATIMRLQADGELDALFGHAGSTLIDIHSEGGSASAVNDMFVRADGSVVAAGGDHRSSRAFVARLLGAGGGESPGVLGVTEQSLVPTAEGGGEVVVHVRRTGGADGSASVAYSTAADSARAGEDFDAVSGLLTWGDADMAEQQIRVPIMSDNSVEEPETFRVILGATQGAGLGTSSATVLIAADGAPFGQFRLFGASESFTESGPAEIHVIREYYSSGAVSVTLTPIAGTATAGADFFPDPITLTWADGEPGAKIARIQITDDMAAETFEDFTVHLSNATGGAVIGPQSSLRVGIRANDQPPPSSGGGGAFGFLSLLLLGLLETIRRLTARGSKIEPLWKSTPFEESALRKRSR
jgi:uncharacterized delta-60 repeat protein